ncbi:MAG: anti-sigma F factor [Lachnospiraceae bacterium]|nr:anti-sigma F factor [Lachnospiraceae bacterium]
MEKNEMEISFDAVSKNEGFARVAVSAFVSHLNPTIEEISDIKTAVSEAVTNSIIHGYENLFGYGIHGDMIPGGSPAHPGKVKVRCLLEAGVLHIDVSDEGRGIEDIEKAMEPLYTTRPELERSGMGFAFMEAFMDDLKVESTPGSGTIVHMKKKMCAGPWLDSEE